MTKVYVLFIITHPTIKNLTTYFNNLKGQTTSKKYN